MESISKAKPGVSVPLRKPDAQTRWKWMAGGAAMGAASAQAGTVQISQLDNFASSTAESLREDLTEDLASDLPGLRKTSSDSTFQTTSRGFTYDATGNKFFLRFNLGTLGYARAFHAVSTANTVITTYTFDRFYAKAGQGVHARANTHYAPNAVNGLFQINFTDAAINGGAQTTGLVDIRAFNTSLAHRTVQIVRLVFDDSSTSAPSGVDPGGSDPEFRGPEIDIRGNGNSIAESDSSPETGDGTDFGSSNIGTPVEHTFTIHNTGSMALAVSSSSASAGDFAVEPVMEDVDPAADTSFKVTFTPGSAGAKFAIITINSDDADEGAYTFLVTGTGVDPAAAPAPAAGNPNAALTTAFSNKIKKLKKSFKKAKSGGNSAKAKKIKAQIKKFKKKLAAL